MDMNIKNLNLKDSQCAIIMNEKNSPDNLELEYKEVQLQAGKPIKKKLSGAAK